jgi:hypothetical protein
MSQMCINRSGARIPVYNDLTGSGEILLSIGSRLGYIYNKEVFVLIAYGLDMTPPSNGEDPFYTVMFNASGTLKQGAIRMADVRNLNGNISQVDVPISAAALETGSYSIFGESNILVFKARRTLSVILPDNTSWGTVRYGNKIATRGRYGGAVGDWNADYLQISHVQKSDGTWQVVEGNGYDYGFVKTKLTQGSMIDTFNLITAGASGTTYPDPIPEPEDTTAPTVWFNGPANNVTHTTDYMTINVGFQDDAPLKLPSKVKIYIDNEKVFEQSISSGVKIGTVEATSVALSSYSIQDGRHTLSTEMWDTAGNKSAKVTQSFTLKKTPTNLRPTSMIDSPGSSFISSATLTMGFEDDKVFASPARWALYAGDPDQAGAIMLTDGSLSGGTLIGGGKYRLTVTKTIDFKAKLGTGEYTLYLRCMDVDSAISEPYIRDITVGDMIDGQIVWYIAPPTTIETSVTIGVQVADNAAIANTKVEWFFDNVSKGTSSVIAIEDKITEGRATFVIPSSVISNNVKTVRIMARFTDSSGNISNIYKDCIIGNSAAPGIRISSAAQGTYGGENAWMGIPTNWTINSTSATVHAEDINLGGGSIDMLVNDVVIKSYTISSNAIEWTQVFKIPVGTAVGTGKTVEFDVYDKYGKVTSAQRTKCNIIAAGGSEPQPEDPPAGTSLVVKITEAKRTSTTLDIKYTCESEIPVAIIQTLYINDIQVATSQPGFALTTWEFIYGVPSGTYPPETDLTIKAVFTTTNLAFNISREDTEIIQATVLLQPPTIDVTITETVAGTNNELIDNTIAVNVTDPNSFPITMIKVYDEYEIQVLNFPNVAVANFNATRIEYKNVNDVTIFIEAINSKGARTRMQIDVRVVDASIKDIVKPIITIIGANSYTILQNNTYTDPGATALDDWDGDITSRIVTTGIPVDTVGLGQRTVTYNVSDLANNAAIAKTRTVNVVFAATPVITLSGVSPMSIEFGDAFVDPGYHGMEVSTNTDITNRVIVTGTVNTEVIGSYVLTYNMTDNFGQAAATVTRTVNVVDTRAPYISVNDGAWDGVNYITAHEINSPYVDAGATAYDTKDGDRTANIVTTGTVNPNVSGEYTITYTVSDITGNTRVATRKVIVSADAVKPEITLVGSEYIELATNDPYTDAGAVVDDGSTITTKIDRCTPVASVTTGIPSDYLVRYDAIDVNGNKAYTAFRTVKVNDTIKPVITLIGSNPLEVVKGTTYVDPGFTATDNKDGNITSSVVVTGTVDMSTVGDYILSYGVTDAAGNTAVAVTRTVKVKVPVPFRSLNTGGYSSLVINSSGQVSATGRNDYGQLGINNTTLISQFIQAPLWGTRVKHFSPNVNCTLAVKSDATLWGAGSHATGQMGMVVGTANYLSPVKLMTNVIEVVSNDTATYVRKGDGTVWAAGQNTYGQLGQGHSNPLSGWYQIPGITTAKKIMCSSNSALVLLDDGTLKAWGRNLNGEIGVNSTTVVSTPTTVPTIAGVVDILATTATFLYLKSDYTIWGAGSNQYYLMDGVDAGNRLSPVQAQASTFNGGNIRAVKFGSWSGAPNSGSALVRNSVSDAKWYAWGYVGSYTFGLSTTQGTTVSAYNQLQDGNAFAIGQYGTLKLIGTANLNGAGPYNYGSLGNGVTGSGATMTFTTATGYPAGTTTEPVLTPDTVAPVIALAGSAAFTIVIGSPYSEPGYTAIDTVDGDLTSSVVVTGTVNHNVLGTYILNYNVSDSSGNAATTATRTITVATVADLSGTATITGIAEVGRTLTAALVGGNNTGTLTYTWKAAGTAVQSGATTTYVPSSGNLGKTITVEITSSIQTGTVVSAPTVAIVASTDPFVNAQTLNFGNTTVVVNAAKSNYYKFTASTMATYIIQSAIGSGDTKATLYNSDRSVSGTSDDEGGNSQFKFSRVLSAGQYMYLQPYYYSSGSTGSYTVNVSTL